MTSISSKWLMASAVALGLGACSRADDKSSTPKEAWDATNAPSIFGVDSVPYLSIPTSAFIPDAKMPWSGDYWATMKGGISNRWQNDGGGHSYRDYLYSPLSAGQVQQLSSAQLNGLSPSEKYDIYTGHLDFPLTRAEKTAVNGAIVNGEVPSWNGICHGWAAASTMEPNAGSTAQVTLADGRAFNFNNADLQALMSRSYADFNFDYAFIGGRCDAQSVQLDAYGRPVDPACRDVNPGTLHLVLGSYIAQRQQAFVADVHNGEQVWNQPIIGYKLSYTNARGYDRNDRLAGFRAPGTTQLVDVNLEMFYVAEARPNVAPQRPFYDSLKVSYSLELDARGYILGGEWTSDDRPDFMWQAHSAPRATPNAAIDYTTVKKLLAASIDGSNPGPGPGPGPGPQPGTVQFDVQNVQVVRDGGLRPLAIAQGVAQGPNLALVQLVAIHGNGSAVVVDQARVGADGRFALQGRIVAALVRELHVQVLDGAGAIVASRTYTISPATP